MKRFVQIVAIIIILLTAWLVLPRFLPGTVDYRGEKIKLTRFYFDYDDYKNDPNNIAPSETLRVQRMVSEAPIAHSFASRKNAVDAVFEIKFPGYAAGGFSGPIRQGEGALNGLLVEIPRAEKYRYFVFRNTGNRYVLVDDFVAPDSLEIVSVAEDNGNLIYSGASGERRLVRPIMKAD